MPQNNPIDEAGSAALRAVREHGLYGRPDSPPKWNKALDGAQAGDPILVKDPDDPRDDFFLVPLIPKNPAAKRGVWVMLDTQSLTLREASLLENWKALAFPDENSGDAEKASQQPHTLSDGTAARFKASDFTPNKKNLVWKASAASILPYWPLKELTAPHPITGEPVSIYVTQDGKVYSALLPDEVAPHRQKPPNQPKKPSPNPPNNGSKTTTTILGIASLALMASTGYLALSNDKNKDKYLNVIAQKSKKITTLEEQISQLHHNSNDRADKNRIIQDLRKQLSRSKKINHQLNQNLTNLNTRLYKQQKTITQLTRQKNLTLKQKQACEIRYRTLHTEHQKSLTGISTQKRLIDRLQKQIEDLLKKRPVRDTAKDKPRP